MPSKSAAQARTMRGAAHDPQFAKRMDIPQHVAREYVEADKGSGNRKRVVKALSRKTERR